MKVCFPVLKFEGVESEVFGHFGSAPAFLLVETDNADLKIITNKDQHHAHGACNPLNALDNHSVDAVVVGGIGPGALNGLNLMGIKVFKADASTVKENIELLMSQKLQELTLQMCCSGHEVSQGCSHTMINPYYPKN